MKEREISAASGGQSIFLGGSSTKIELSENILDEYIDKYRDVLRMYIKNQYIKCFNTYENIIYDNFDMFTELSEGCVNTYVNNLMYKISNE